MTIINTEEASYKIPDNVILSKIIDKYIPSEGEESPVELIRSGLYRQGRTNNRPQDQLAYTEADRRSQEQELGFSGIVSKRDKS